MKWRSTIMEFIIPLAVGITFAGIIGLITWLWQWPERQSRSWAKHHTMWAPVVVAQPCKDSGVFYFEQVFYEHMNRFGVAGWVITNGRSHQLDCPGGERCKMKWMNHVEEAVAVCPEPRCGLVWDGETVDYDPVLIREVRKQLGLDR